MLQTLVALVATVCPAPPPVHIAHARALPDPWYAQQQFHQCDLLLEQLKDFQRSGQYDDPVGMAWLEPRLAETTWQRDVWKAAYRAAAVRDEIAPYYLSQLRSLTPRTYPQLPVELWEFP